MCVCNRQFFWLNLFSMACFLQDGNSYETQQWSQNPPWMTWNQPQLKLHRPSLASMNFNNFQLFYGVSLKVIGLQMPPMSKVVEERWKRLSQMKKIFFGRVIVGRSISNQKEHSRRRQNLINWNWEIQKVERRPSLTGMTLKPSLWFAVKWKKNRQNHQENKLCKSLFDIIISKIQKIGFRLSQSNLLKGLGPLASFFPIKYLALKECVRIQILDLLNCIQHLHDSLDHWTTFLKLFEFESYCIQPTASIF